jgi:hypothetical protein
MLHYQGLPQRKAKIFIANDEGANTNTTENVV